MNQITTPYFTIPQALIRSGVLRDMKPCEAQLVLALHHEMERLSRSVFSITNAELANMTGLSASSLRIARTKLMERGVISLSRIRGGVYEYSLLNPETRNPWERRIPKGRGQRSVSGGDTGGNSSGGDFGAGSYKAPESTVARDFNPFGVPSHP